VTLLGARALGSALEFPLREHDEAELARSGVAASVRGRNYICIHPGAGQRDKCWPAPRFAELADQLAREFGLDIVLTGSAQEADLTAAVARHMRMAAIDTAGPLSIGAMAALMRGARLLVCNDTGVSHIAAGLGLKSVVVFSTADIARWAPLNGQLHRCIADPQGSRAAEVLALARSQLALP
jgi:ADP-heptose:LPS heptosyltransferase